MRSSMMQTPLSLNQLLEHVNALFSSRVVVSRRPPTNRCNAATTVRSTGARAIVFGFSGAPLPPGCENYEDFIAADASGYRHPEQDENEAMGMCYKAVPTSLPD